MHTFNKFLEITYLVIGLVFLFQGFEKYATEPEKAYISLGFGALAIFMFFFKRRFRKRRSK